MTMPVSIALLASFTVICGSTSLMDDMPIVPDLPAGECVLQMIPVCEGVEIQLSGGTWCIPTDEPCSFAAVLAEANGLTACVTNDEIENWTDIVEILRIIAESQGMNDCQNQEGPARSPVPPGENGQPGSEVPDPGSGGGYDDEGGGWGGGGSGGGGIGDPDPPGNFTAAGRGCNSLLSADPVNVVTGAKSEFTLDLAVRALGSDFNIVRHTTSNPLHAGPGLVGNNQTLSTFIHIIPFQDYRVLWDDSHWQVTLVDVSVNRTFRTVEPQPEADHPAEGTILKASGPATDYFIATTTGVGGWNRKVWRHVIPNAGERDYYRIAEGELEYHLNGLIAQEFDVHGNKRVYHYGTVSSPDGPIPVLNRITVNPGSIAWPPEPPSATIRFLWNTGAGKNGRLREILVTRHNGPHIAMQTVQRVRYRYAGSSHSNPALGVTDDLIQIEYHELLDDDQWRVGIRQERYHNPNENEAMLLGDAIYGREHQLKLIIEPEQIEYYARQSGQCVEDAALSLLAKDDTQVVVDNIRVVDLASKIMTQYETDPGGRILVQYVQSDCGCAGGGPGRKLLYDYWGYDHRFKTTKISEYILEDGIYTLHHTTYRDYRHLGDDFVPYIEMTAVVAPDPDGRVWATRHEYNAERLETKRIMPSAMTSYVPGQPGDGSSSAIAPTFQVSASHGLVYQYKYNDRKLLSATLVREGGLGFSLLEEIIYGDETDEVLRYLEVERRKYTVGGIVSGEMAESSNYERTLFAYGFHQPGTFRIAWRESRIDAEDEHENGPGGHYTTVHLYDTNGSNTWIRAADGTLTMREYDQYTGGVITEVHNASWDNAQHPYAIGPSMQWGRSGSYAMVFKTTYDAMGRIRSHTVPGHFGNPSGVTTYISREIRPFLAGGESYGYYAEVSLPHVINAATGEVAGPAQINWFTASGAVRGHSRYALSTSHMPTYSSDDITNYTLGVEIARQENLRDLRGRLMATRVWYQADMNHPLLALVPDAYYETSYNYNDRGRKQFTFWPNGTVTEYHYDVLDRLKAKYIGIRDANGDPSEMAIVSEYFYDSDETGVETAGNGNLTLQKTYVSDSDTRVTRYAYDDRDRLVATENPLPPHSFVVYDQQDRVIESATFSELPVGIAPEAIHTNLVSRLSYSETRFGRRGLPYVIQSAIDPSSATPEFVESHIWYDQRGREVGRWTPGAAATKATFDPHGRLLASYTTDRGGDPPPGVGSYDAVYSLTTHASNVAGDHVFQQVEYSYNSAGLVDLVTVRCRTHDVHPSHKGSLDPSTFLSSGVVSLYTGVHYDRANRQIRKLDFGTNTDIFKGGNAPVWPPSTYSLYDDANYPDAIITQQKYDHVGRVNETIDPESRVTRLYSDALSRNVAVVENYDAAGGDITFEWSHTLARWNVSAYPPEAPSDANRVTTYVYDASNNVINRVAHMPGSAPDQVTAYVYGISPSTGSDIASNGLLYRVQYPDRATGAPGNAPEYWETYTYNRAGDVISLVDQNEVKHVYALDEMGRVLRDDVEFPPGSDLDGTVQALVFTFDDAGRRLTAESRDATDNIINAVAYEYDEITGELISLWQNPDGAIITEAGSSQSARVAYTYATVVSDGLPYRRLASVIYPDGTEVLQKYGAGSSIDSKVNRLTAMQLSGANHDLVQYAYMGLATPAIVDYAEPDVRLDPSVEYNGNQYQGEYPGWDRFGRPVAQRWIDGDGFERKWEPSSDDWAPIPQIVELAYTYDKRGNVVERRDDRPGLQWSHRHEALEYDGLHRLVEAKRGAHESGGFTYAPSSQQWELDVLGNWLTMATDADSSGSYHATESREHNAANELEQRTFDALAPPAPLSYDDAGNLILQRLPFSSTDVTYVHDGWNRLTEVRYNDVLRASFTYNALHQRVSKISDTRPYGTIDQRQVMYYSVDWQLLEEHIDDDYVAGGTYSPNQRAQYFWGNRGLDDIILRRVNGSFNGPYNEFYYHLTDTQFSTVCVIDESATVLERVSYDAYGRARHHRATDLTGDGATTRDDKSLVQANLGLTGGTGGVADLNRDGVVDANDLAIVDGDIGPALASGLISSNNVGNPLGYAGYHFNAEMQVYLARHRYYDPVLGRWLTRDPAGYVDGMNLYLYGLGSPFVFVDPMGLESWLSRCNPVNWFRGKPDPNEQQIALNRLREQGLLEGGVNPNNLISEALNDSDVRQEVAAYRDEISQAAREGGAEGLVDGAAIVGNAATMGMIPSLNTHVDDLVDNYGAAYQIANISAQAGVELGLMVTGVGLAGRVVDTGTDAARIGRAGRQARLRQLANDPKLSSADRGWIRQEMNSVARRNQPAIRNPPGKELAHSRGREARKGFSHTESPSRLQEKILHQLQHKHDRYGRKP